MSGRRLPVDGRFTHRVKAVGAGCVLRPGTRVRIVGKRAGGVLVRAEGATRDVLLGRAQLERAA